MMAVTLVVTMLLLMYAMHYFVMLWRYGSSHRLAHRHLTYERRRMDVVRCLASRVQKVHVSDLPSGEVHAMLRDAGVDVVPCDSGPTRFTFDGADAWSPTSHPLSLRLLEVLCNV